MKSRQFAVGNMKTFTLMALALMMMMMRSVEAGVASSPTYYDINADKMDDLSNDEQQLQPKQSYNKKRRIKGELKRRTLTNDPVDDNNTVQQEEALLNEKGNDDEDLDHYLRFLQFSMPVRLRLRGGGEMNLAPF